MCKTTLQETKLVLTLNSSASTQQFGERITNAKTHG
jgi:hypothetical protein